MGRPLVRSSILITPTNYGRESSVYFSRPSFLTSRTDDHCWITLSFCQGAGEKKEQSEGTKYTGAKPSESTSIWKGGRYGCQSCLFAPAFAFSLFLSLRFAFFLVFPPKFVSGSWLFDTTECGWWSCIRVYVPCPWDS